MSAWLPGLLIWVQVNGYAAVWAALFIAAAGVPLPISLVLLAVGAFSAVGDFNLSLLALVAISGSVAGDQLGYGIGHWWGRRLLLWIGRSPHLDALSTHAIIPAEAYFARYGGWAVFLTRFIVSGLGGTTNLVAGATRYQYRRFLLADISGEALGAIIPLSLGYLFGASWEAVSDVLNAASLFGLAAVTVLILAMSLWRITHRIPRRQDQVPQDQVPCAQPGSPSVESGWHVAQSLPAQAGHYPCGGDSGDAHAWLGVEEPVRARHP